MFEKFKFYPKTHVFKRESKWQAYATAKITKLWSNIDPKSTYDSPTIEPNEITPLPKCIILSNSTSFKEQKKRTKKIQHQRILGLSAQLARFPCPFVCNI